MTTSEKWIQDKIRDLLFTRGIDAHKVWGNNLMKGFPDLFCGKFWIEVKAEGEKQSVVLEAEGRREAAFRDAEARERSAEAEARATQVVSEAIATSGTQALNYFVAQKYTEAVAAFATSPNAKTILFPVEATQLIGSIGGIGELVKDALGTPGPRK